MGQRNPVPTDHSTPQIVVIRHDLKPLKGRKPIHAHNQGIGARRQIAGNVEDIRVGDTRALSPAREPEQSRRTAPQGRFVVALCLDLKARIHDEPLWQTLGASSRRVRAYASGIDMPLSDDDLRAFYERMAALGVCAGKLKCGLSLDDDLRRIGIMRDALATSGKTPELCIDVNEYWSPKQTIRYMHVIEQAFDITWIEEPARRWDVDGLRKVSDSIRAAVASGENLDALDDYVPLLSARAIDVLNLGQRAGGITGAMKVADVAYAFETPVSMMNCAANFMAHVGAVLPNHIMMEVLDNGRDAVLTHSHPIEDGWIVLNDEPGLGFTFDEDRLAACAVEGAGGRFGWGRRRGAGM